MNLILGGGISGISAAFHLQKKGMNINYTIAYNYYKGMWLKHPAQNNLAPLPINEKIEIIRDFVNKSTIVPDNYNPGTDSNAILLL
jgi:protoporphyrinogen oxidase